MINAYSVRRSLGLTQKEFSALLGVSESAVEAWEQGVRSMNSTTQSLFLFLTKLPKVTSCKILLEEAKRKASGNLGELEFLAQVKAKLIANGVVV